MNPEQTKTLHAIAAALQVMAGESFGEAASGQQASMRGDSLMRDNSARGAILGEGPKHESEIDREMKRLDRALESLQLASEVLWKRANTITSPPAPMEGSCATAIESCGSQLGNSIQSQALRADAVASSLRYLSESLAV